MSERSEMTFTSPQYPRPYQSMLTCHYYIEASPGQEMEVVITDLDLEEDYDNLIVCNGFHCDYCSANNNVVGKYTGGVCQLLEVMYPFTVVSSQGL